MKTYKNVVALLVMTAVFTGGLFGCMKKEGPAERAGKKIDETVTKGGEQIEKAGKKIQEDVKGK